MNKIKKAFLISLMISMICIFSSVSFADDLEGDGNIVIYI